MSTNNFGQIAKAKGKELPLEICYKPLLGYFIGTKLLDNDNNIIFTKESIEVFDILAQAVNALDTNAWEQALDCQIFESD